MNDTVDGGDLEPVAEHVETDADEDHGYDTFDDAVDALDDEEGEEEQSDEPADEPEDGEAEGEEDSEDADAVVTLPNGEKLTVSELEELRANGLRQADYTHKTTELAEQRKAVEADRARYDEQVQFIESALQGLSVYLEGLLPPEPSLQLAQSNPNEYQYQKALREQAMAEIGRVVQAKDGVAQHKQQASNDDLSRHRDAEAAKLVKAMPHLSDPVKRQAFDKSVRATALEFGFSEDEITKTADHRVLQLVHYARMGKRAEHNRNNAKKRTETPKKGKAKPAQVTAKQAGNRQAMQRLSKSGSFEDAMSVDFD